MDSLDFSSEHATQTLLAHSAERSLGQKRIPRVALIHDWLTGMRGGEKCLEYACRRWPSALLYTLLHKRGSVSPEIESLRPIVSPVGRLPQVDRYYRYLLPILPLAVNWRMPAELDLVLSFSHCVAKAVKPPAGVPHVSYCFTPMRYAWHMKHAYFQSTSLKAHLIEQLLSRLREWDRRTASRVTHFIAISDTVRQRIRECYDRDSVVIHPPVDTDFYSLSQQSREEFYLVVSAFAPYKRFDLAIQACTRLKQNLVVIGKGQDETRLRSLAGPTVRFLGWQPDEVIRDHYQRAKALLFPAEEDFGIVPVEAQACGCPVIAFGRGGCLETVRPRISGLFFEEQNVDSLIAALEEFQSSRDRFDPRLIRKNALPFRRQRYEEQMTGYIDSVLQPRETRRAA